MTRVTRIRRRIENATYRMVPLMQLRLFQRSSKSVKPMRFRSSLLLQAKCTYVYFPTPITLHWSKIANFYAPPVFNVPVQEDLVGISLRFIHMGKLKSWIYLVVKNVDTFKQLLHNTIIRQTSGHPHGQIWYSKDALCISCAYAESIKNVSATTLIPLII